MLRIDSSGKQGTAMAHEGGCHCGSVRYLTSDTPVRAMACHCSSCKLRSGSPYGVGVYFDQSEVQLKGEVQTYRFESDTTGRWIQNEFCPRCGVTVSWTLQMRPGTRAIAGGTFDDPNWFPLDAHIWTQSARQDMRYPEGMPVHERALP